MGSDDRQKGRRIARMIQGLLFGWVLRISGSSLAGSQAFLDTGSFQKISVWYTRFRDIRDHRARSTENWRSVSKVRSAIHFRSVGEAEGRPIHRHCLHGVYIHTPRSLHIGVPSLLLHQVAQAVLQPQLPSFIRGSSCCYRVRIQGREQLIFNVLQDSGFHEASLADVSHVSENRIMCSWSFALSNIAARSAGPVIAPMFLPPVPPLPTTTVTAHYSMLGSYCF